MSSKKSNTSDSRSRAWATIVYPESMPDNIWNTLSEQHTAIAVSPLHDKDIDQSGDLKKPHYHVLFTYESPKSVEQMIDIVKSICGVGLLRVSSVRGMTRYLTHKDDPDKIQYRDEDVRTFGGFDYVGHSGLAVDKYKAIREMMDFIQERNVLSYAYLLEYAGANRQDWFRVLCDSSTYVMEKYIKSRSWAQLNPEYNMAND